MLRQIIAALLGFPIPEPRAKPVEPPFRNVPHRWRCPCGAKARDTQSSEFLADLRAQAHWLRQSQPHPKPETYPVGRP